MIPPQQLLDLLRPVLWPLTTELQYSTPFQLLMAVMLSAQTTDKKVNQVTPALFAAVGDDPSRLADMSESEILSLIAGVNYAPTKARNLKQWGTLFPAVPFFGQIPNDRETLKRLPWVGQKTANVVLSVLYQAPFIAVDTHVARVSFRLWYTRHTDPAQIERELETIVEPDLRHDFHHALILHGRRTCSAKKPQCQTCVLADQCPKNGVTLSS